MLEEMQQPVRLQTRSEISSEMSRRFSSLATRALAERLARTNAMVHDRASLSRHVEEVGKLYQLAAYAGHRSEALDALGTQVRALRSRLGQ